MSKTKHSLVPKRGGYRVFNDYPITLQEHEGAPMEIARVSMPSWLSRSEAERICSVVMAVAVANEDVAALWRDDEAEDPTRYGGRA